MKQDADIQGVKWTADDIVALLEMDNQAVERAIVVIYERQTQEEKAFSAVVNVNGIGFSQADVKFGTSLAKGCLRYGHLTMKQLFYARKMAIKYREQLVDVANDRLLMEMEKSLA